MQKKFTVKKNNVKIIKNSKNRDEETSSSIARKSLSDELHINIITSARVDVSNADRLKTPLEAEREKRKAQFKEKKKRRAVKSLSLKSVPTIPTAPKDPVVRRRKWLISQISSHISRIDLPFALSVLLLALCGIIAINSATLSFESKKFVIVQCAGVLLGVFSALVLSVIDYRSLRSKYTVLIVFNMSILLITYIFGSSVTEGTNSNWIDLGFIKIQPSEFAKLLFIYCFAVHLSQVRGKMHKFSTIISLGFHAGLIFALVLLQRDLGSLTIFLIIFISMCFAAGLSIWYYIGGGAFALAISPFIWAKLNEYQKNRILLCFDESIDPMGTGIRYQQLRSQTAIGGGGIFGVGYTRGTVTQGLTDHLPAKHTDMIFSTICEEWGIIGAVIILAITCFIIFRTLKIALSCGNTTGCYICVGVAAMFMIQVVENVGMCLGIMPVIGITYPFLSYGGSSVLSCFIAAGMVLSVSTHSENKFFN